MPRRGTQQCGPSNSSKPLQSAARSLVWMAGMAVGQHNLPTGSCRHDRVSIDMETRSCLKKSSFRTAERYRAAPFVEQRERYLVHLRETGARRATLRRCANDQLSLVRLLKPKEGSRVRLSQIEAVTAVWSQPKARRCDRSASPKARTRFVCRGIQWLRFLGWLDEPEHEHHPQHGEVAAPRARPFPRRPYKTTAAPSTASSGWHGKAHRWTPSRWPTSTMPLRQSAGGGPGAPNDTRLRSAPETILPVCRSARLVPSRAGCGDHGASVHGGRDRAEGSKARGCPLASSTVQAAFDALRHIAGIRGTAGGRQIPRLHDLRHYVSFLTMSGTLGFVMSFLANFSSHWRHGLGSFSQPCIGPRAVNGAPSRSK
jgi:hypothetical protein